MAENRSERPASEPNRASDPAAAVPRARTPAGDAAGEQPQPRKRAKKAAKTTRTAAAKQAAPPAEAKRPATEAASGGKSAAKRATKKAVKKAPTTAAPPARKEAAKPAKPAKKAAKAAKKAAKAAKKAGQPERPAELAEPAVPAEPVGSGSAAEPVGAAPGAWMAAAWAAVREPGRPPHRLGELAVAEIGPRAAAWADWLRRTYPGAPADGIARLATRHAARTARTVTLTGVGGPITAAFTMPATAWVRATVVLRIAAAYGHDPAAPERVPELLELLELGPAAEAEQPEGRAARVEAFARRLDWVRPRLLLASPRRPLTVLGLLAGVAEEGHASERLAHRAIRRYRPGSQSSRLASARSSSSP